jgi:hypothetical protein
MAVYPVVVMSISIACALLFALLGVPFVNAALVRFTALVLKMCAKSENVSARPAEGIAHEGAERDDAGGDVTLVTGNLAPSHALGISASDAGANPMLRASAAPARRVNPLAATAAAIEMVELNVEADGGEESPIYQQRCAGAPQPSVALRWRDSPLAARAPAQHRKPPPVPAHLDLRGRTCRCAGARAGVLAQV